MQTMRHRLLKERFVTAQNDQRRRRMTMVSQFMADRCWRSRIRSASASARRIWAAPGSRSSASCRTGGRTALRQSTEPTSRSRRNTNRCARCNCAHPRSSSAHAARGPRDPRTRSGPAGLRRDHGGADDPGAERVFLLGMGALFSGALGLLGLALALVGVYGVVSCTAGHARRKSACAWRSARAAPRSYAWYSAAASCWSAPPRSGPRRRPERVPPHRQPALHLPRQCRDLRRRAARPRRHGAAAFTSQRSTRPASTRRSRFAPSSKFYIPVASASGGRSTYRERRTISFEGRFRLKAETTELLIRIGRLRDLRGLL